MATADSFVVYASFFEALEDVPAEEYKECITILSNYALKGEEPEKMSPYAKMFFRMAKPVVDANLQRREAGKRGGEAKASKGEAKASKGVAKASKGEAKASKGVANGKQTLADEDVDEDVDADGDGDGGTPYPLSATAGLVEDIEAEQIAELGVDIYAAESLSNWIKSRSEKREPITESEFKALVSTVQSSIQRHGVTAVRNQIQESMANGYKGLCLDRLDQKPRNRAAPDKTNVLDGLTDSASKFLARGSG